ncbi:YtxH domain-containing protein [Polaribacter sp. PL03]|uniref:YtxH domain-containing protein n=1 Tax=Polaribacter sp. PL03 TaxID=3088353 RepID=UPI0029D05485|nr:YtxH domain-containing protein [Polaribacter sp. PL03]MDX6747104.1 YtxH domain-containing protein [Polaribacter sp. PL03]
MSNSSNTVVGLLAGTVIGAALGILFAPDKGEKTRQRISEEALAAKDKMAERAAELTSQVSSTVTNQKESLDTQLESVVSNVSHKAEDVITTLEKKLKELKEKNKKLQKPA